MAVKAAEVDKDVKLWRYQELRALGLPPDDAITLADTMDVVASARRLLEQGCPIELVVILLSD